MPHRRSFLTKLAAGAAGLSLGPLAEAQSASVRVAAASDLKFALAALALRFEQETGLKVAITFGSSGNLARQLEQGLPMDLFMSADEALIFRLAKSGWARKDKDNHGQEVGVVYGRGQLVWMVQKSSPAKLDEGLKGLLAALGRSGKLAMAHPEHAPYGRAAQSALQSLGLWQAVQSRLVLGESVTQATQFVSTGAAPCGLVALSLALAPELVATTRYATVKATLYPPIIQRMAMSASAPVAALKFYTFLQTDASKVVLRANGLGV